MSNLEASSSSAVGESGSGNTGERHSNPSGLNQRFDGLERQLRPLLEFQRQSLGIAPGAPLNTTSGWRAARAASDDGRRGSGDSRARQDDRRPEERRPDPDQRAHEPTYESSANREDAMLSKDLNDMKGNHDAFTNLKTKYQTAQLKIKELEKQVQRANASCVANVDTLQDFVNELAGLISKMRRRMQKLEHELSGAPAWECNNDSDELSSEGDFEDDDGDDDDDAPVARRAARKTAGRTDTQQKETEANNVQREEVGIEDVNQQEELDREIGLQVASMVDYIAGA